MEMGGKKGNKEWWKLGRSQSAKNRDEWSLKPHVPHDMELDNVTKTNNKP